MLVAIGIMLFIIKKTNYYLALLPWAIGIMQLCELPFMPIFPAQYLIITASWAYASLFFLTVLSFQTLL